MSNGLRALYLIAAYGLVIGIFVIFVLELITGKKSNFDFFSALALAGIIFTQLDVEEIKDKLGIDKKSMKEKDKIRRDS